MLGLLRLGALEIADVEREPDAVVQAVLASPSEQLLVLVDPDGTINAVPYTS